MGYYHATEGDILVGGREQAIANPKDAHALGLGMVYQHFTLVPAMTVAENLVLARDDVPAVVNWPKEMKELEAFLARMPFKVPLAAKVSDISAGERQKCEILKQLYLKRRFLILDEPTSVLTPAEADEVLGMLRDMVVKGELTILMITHKFREVMAFADEVTILRRGKLAGAGKVAELTPDAMARTMIGAEELTVQPPRTGEAGEARLELARVRALDDAGAIAVHDVSLTVRAGEIVGIAGVSGNGQRQLVEVLAGQREAEGGEIRVAGDPYHASREEMRRHKMSLLPEEPLKNACVGGMSVADNIAFREFDRAPFASGGWWLNRGAFRDDAKKKIGQYKIKTRTPDTPISALSGGNVQRAVLARELGGDVEVLIAANPCFGLDFAAVAQIHAEIMAARNRGAAVLLVSEDLDELLELSDRLVVMFHGEFVYEARTSEADLTEVGRHMAGHCDRRNGAMARRSRTRRALFAPVLRGRPPLPHPWQPSLRLHRRRCRRQCADRDRERLHAGPRRHRACRAPRRHAGLPHAQPRGAGDGHALFLRRALRDVRRRDLLGRHRPRRLWPQRAPPARRHRQPPGEPDARPALPRGLCQRPAADGGRGPVARGRSRSAARRRVDEVATLVGCVGERNPRLRPSGKANGGVHLRLMPTQLRPIRNENGAARVLRGAIVVTWRLQAIRTSQ